MDLSNQSIIRSVTSGAIGIKPFSLESVQPSSYDLHLAPTILVMKDEEYDQAMGDIWTEYNLGISRPPFCLLGPGAFALASTIECIRLPAHIKGEMVGLSSVARTGLLVECAGLADPGWDGQLTLELKNLSPRRILLKPGQRICQISFVLLDQPADPPYQGRYLNQEGPTPARPERESVQRP